MPDLREEDIAGSGFAITGYTVHPGLGGDAALARLRERLRKRGLRLMLDFVPNHTALDHSWVDDHPEYYIPGTELDLARAPQNYTWVKRKRGDLLLAHGRDPYFSGWPDTLQLDYSNPATQEAMIGELLRIAGQCDGVRCDMAMLVLPDVFERTWGRRAPLFWPEATRRVREQVPGFRFMAEVYWDLEWTMLQQGFDYAYDKRLYDRLREAMRGRCASISTLGSTTRAGSPGSWKTMTSRGPPRRSLAECTRPRPSSPTCRRACGSSIRGNSRVDASASRRTWSVRRSSPLKNRYSSSTMAFSRCSGSRPFGTELGACVDCAPAWDGNWTSDCFIAWCWQGADGQRRLIAVNYADHRSQCYVRFPFAELSSRAVQLKDLAGPVTYHRDGNELVLPGLYLDLQAWGFHVFDVEAMQNGASAFDNSSAATNTQARAALRSAAGP